MWFWHWSLADNVGGNVAEDADSLALMIKKINNEIKDFFLYLFIF